MVYQIYFAFSPCIPFAAALEATQPLPPDTAEPFRASILARASDASPRGLNRSSSGPAGDDGPLPDTTTRRGSDTICPSWPAMCSATVSQ